MQAEVQHRWAVDGPLFASALLDAEKSAPTFLTSIGGVNDPRRYAVYKNNVTVSLIRAMEANFPAIVRLVGDEFFTALARVFVEKYPPRTRILAQYGVDFPAFLEGFEPLAAYPYLGDVARLESAWREAFHESDERPLETTDLAQVGPDDVANLRFRAHAATRLQASRYASGSIFSANRGGDTSIVIDPAKPEYALITRPDFGCALRVLSPAQGVFVSSLLEGVTLADAAERAGTTGEPFDLASSITGVLSAGAFSEFSIG